MERLAGLCAMEAAMEDAIRLTEDVTLAIAVGHRPGDAEAFRLRLLEILGRLDELAGEDPRPWHQA